MNKANRGKVDKALKLIAEAQAKAAEGKAILANMRDELQERLDTMSDAARDSDAGVLLEEEVAALNDFIDQQDAHDLSSQLAELGHALDINTPDVEGPRISEDELEAKREARLPGWVRERLDQAEARLQAANAELAETFGNATGEPGEFTVWRHHPRLGGRRIPVERIDIASCNLTISVQEIMHEKGKWALEVHGQRDVQIHPMSNNMVRITGSAF